MIRSLLYKYTRFIGDLKIYSEKSYELYIVQNQQHPRNFYTFNLILS